MISQVKDKNVLIKVFMTIGWGSTNIDNGLKLCILPKETSFESSRKGKKGVEYLCFLKNCILQILSRHMTYYNPLL